MIGKDAKDVSVEDALDYVGGYTAGNDVSSRKLQRDPEFAGRVPQWGFSKGFDTFAPLGPVLVAPALIPDPSKLHLKTIVDDQVRQDESVSDLLFDSKYIISYLSSGTTLQKGSVIMTGTPGGKTSPPESIEPPVVPFEHVNFQLTMANRCRSWAQATEIPDSGDKGGG